MGPIALGGGWRCSIRMPAGFTGVYGIKPTSGRRATYRRPSVGTMTDGPVRSRRNVGDAALMLAFFRHGLARSDGAAAAGCRFFSSGSMTHRRAAHPAQRKSRLAPV